MATTLVRLSMNILVFDIETVPDVESGRRLYGHMDMSQLSDEEVARVMFHERYQETEGKTEMLRHHLQKVIAIAAVLNSGKTFKVGSLCDHPEATEKELIQRFFDIIQQTTPLLVSWNGSGFDLPVLHYRALLHGVAAPVYWKIHGEPSSQIRSYVWGGQEHSRGEKARFRYNNYLSRYHERHTDLMDVLAAYQPSAFASLGHIATMLGFPGKLGMSGDQVWETYSRGELQKIRHYCETDVLNTYLIFLRFELIRGYLTKEGYLQECQRVRDSLADKSHFKEFLEAWEVTKSDLQVNHP